MKPLDGWIGMEVYVEKLRPYNSFRCQKRQEGLEGFIVARYQGWQENCWIVRHVDNTEGIYFSDEIETIHVIGWYKVRKMYGCI